MKSTSAKVFKESFENTLFKGKELLYYMQIAKVQTSLHINTVSLELMLFTHVSCRLRENQPKN